MDVNRREVSIHAPAIGADGTVLAYGHWGRPVLAFPSEQGPAWQYEERGMVAALDELLDAGRIKLYCVSSFDSESWHAQHLPMEQRAIRHGAYEDWIVNQVVPFIRIVLPSITWALAWAASVNVISWPSTFFSMAVSMRSRTVSL